MKILITGSSGRIGRAIYVRLGREHDVVGLDRAPSSSADVLADLHDECKLAQALRNADAIVHTAALHAPHVGSVSDAEFERVNVAATRRLLELAIDAGVSRFVLTSTTAVYGGASSAPKAAAWIDEQTIPQPKTIYHRTKLAAEEEVRLAAKRYGISATALRMSRCFPEPASLMAAYRLHRGIDARDVASAHELVLQLNEPGFHIYVASCATPFDRSDCPGLAADAAEVLRRKAPALVAAYEARSWNLPGSIDRVYSSQALQAKGWTPRYGFEAVLRMLDDESSEVLPETRRGDSRA